MDQKQGEMIDSIIEMHRHNEGKIFEWNPFFIKFINENKTEEFRTIIFSLYFLKSNAYISEYDKNLVITMLTEKGQQWKNYKSYLKNHDAEIKADVRKAWKEKNWLLIALTAFVIGFFSSLSVEFISKKYFPESKESISTSTKVDTSDSYKRNHDSIVEKTLKYNTNVKR